MIFAEYLVVQSAFVPCDYRQTVKRFTALNHGLCAAIAGWL